MNKDLRLADNLRYLRESYGEAQLDVALAIGVEKNTISNYECGIRSPKPDTLKKLARHFLISVEDLLKNDYSNLPRREPNPKALNQSYEVMFPIVSSDEALQDSAFRKGVQAHKAFYTYCRSENRDEDQGGALLDEIIERYIEAMDGPAEKEAIANWISVWFLIHFAIFAVPDVVDAEAAPIELLRKKNQKFDHDIYDFLEEREDDPDWDKDIAEFIDLSTDPETQEMLTESLKILRGSEEYRDVADFFLAMQYFCGVVRSGLSAEINRRVGLEMMDAFAKMGNPMARRFLRFGKDAWRFKHN